LSSFLRHERCSECGSSDARSLYDDGHTYCFVCEAYTPPNKNNNETQVARINNNKIRPLPDNFTELADRRISVHTARKFGVTNIPDEANVVKHVYPYYTKDGVHVANKLRTRTKGFLWEGESGPSGLFGQQLFPAGSAKFITLVEGECDAMAAFELMGSRWPVVSVHSAPAASKNVADQFEYLNAFENIVVCFDKDDAKVKPDGSVHYPGQEAALSVAAMFPIGKVKVLTLAEAKDPNDYLIQGKASAFTKEWWAAPVFTPTGIKLGKDMWDEISTQKNHETVLYPWKSLNDQTYGIRLSELVVITADTGTGKTSVVKEIESHILLDEEIREKNYGVGFLHLEEPNSDTALGLMSITANKPLHLPDVRANTPVEELREYYDASVNTDRVVIWDHFGSNSIHEVLAKIRHMHNLGCKYIVVDHLSIIVSDQSGDERKQLDEISTKLKTLCMELNIAVIAVIHQNRQGQIRGTAGVEQLANIVLKLFRDKEDVNEWRRNVTKIVIQKNRFCGRTGPGAYLWYNEITGRLEELEREQIIAYETGQAVTKEEMW
jgi:twinkle protein